ncbi:MAG: 2-hydroxychromene-2-carboxylate isomerase [Xanthobacteraceae bacterium]|nr:2-hydroxychromene-2-carboxylate isomerase [Xanthobacteraceae bacterium]
MREEVLKKVEFFFDFGSPTTYLAHTQMPGLVQRTGAEIVYRPMLLGAVFKATGNQSPAFIAAKAKWMDGDLKAFAKRYGVPYERNPWFPVNTMMLMRGAIAMQKENRFASYADAIFRAMWVEPQNLNDPQVVGAVLAKAGFEPKHLLAAIEHQPVKDELRANTEEAVSRGVFGAPSFFVGDKMFFGQDRLDFVEEALRS